MEKFQRSKTIFLVLVTAFLSMQWSPAHIHLAEHHNHGGGQHHHNIEVHVHQRLSSSHHQSFYVTNGADNHDVNVVDIQQEFSLQNYQHLMKILFQVNTRSTLYH